MIDISTGFSLKLRIKALELTRLLLSEMNPFSSQIEAAPKLFLLDWHPATASTPNGMQQSS